ncbi:hypothetical protein PybrP1_001703 [[Pythium] brassicae (nom. inval.)]|nr:hypothetical protein PybrP1_001703 [[Pythium] brassicae (nom. inval.)]
MRRQSLRPRQIDVHARMRIIRSEEDLVLDDESAGGGTNAGGSQPTATFEELIGSLDEKQHAAAAAAAATAHKPKRKKNIPIPVNLTVASYDEAVKDDFVAPSSYVRFQTVPLANEDEKVDLDLEFAELKWLKQHPKYGDDGDPRYQISPETLARMLDALEKASALINPSVITPAEAEEVFARQLQMAKTPLNRVTVDVYNYWVQKRQALKRPLLRKYWPQTPLNDTNPHLVFRPREKERYKLRKHRKNDMEGYRKLQQLRADCERVLRLLDLVKRREKAKRLSVDFLDEIRRQAVHELTARGGDVRKPTVPVDDDARGKGRKKKKKRKHRRDGEGDDGAAGGAADAIGHANGDGGDRAAGADATKSAVAGATGVAGGTADAGGGGAAGGGAAAAAAGTGAATQRVATFLEYDTSQNFSLLDDDAEQDPKAPYFPSYPAPPSHLMAAVFMQPPKYRCRGRIGRGGRLVIDRIPVPPARYYGPTEQSATVGKWAEPARAGGAPPAATVGEAINSSHHAAILIHETSFRPLASKLEGVTSKRLDEIYRMSDSEDELLEPLTASVDDVSGLPRKPATGGTSASAATATGGKTGAVRATKFALDI